MDLNTLDTSASAEQGTDVELDDPAGLPLANEDGTRWTITVRGEDSPSVRAVVKKQQNRFTERLRKRGQFGDADSQEAEIVEKLVAATAGWKGLVMDGKPYEFNQANAQKLYGAPGLSWITEQVSAAMVDRKRFFAKVSKP